ncbi:MAG: butyrate kinase [Oscillospiraceae bacterium]|nr:butyrate kinase [Oscillospiraceae bacterium]
MERLLVINPGSTSTKIAVYDEEEQAFLISIPHSTQALKAYRSVSDQYDFRRALVLETLAEKGYRMEDFSCVVGRGGILPPVSAGAYEVNEDMVWQLRYAPVLQHASNLGGLIAYAIAKPLGIPAYIYDAVAVDEMPEMHKLTGWVGIERVGHGHNLNMRATAIRYAEERSKRYDESSVVVCHLGGGISVSLHYKGRIIDIINDEDGSFTPERAGALPMAPFVRKIFREGWDETTVLKKLKSEGGLTAHLHTNDSREVEQRIANGDEKARMVYEAMAMNVARNIAREFPVVNGDVEAIVLTGGIAYSTMFTSMLAARLSFLCPVVVYPGENEMQSLAEGALRVLRGEETAKTYHKVEI